MIVLASEPFVLYPEIRFQDDKEAVPKQIYVSNSRLYFSTWPTQGFENCNNPFFLLENYFIIHFPKYYTIRLQRRQLLLLILWLFLMHFVTSLKHTQHIVMAAPQLSQDGKEATCRLQVTFHELSSHFENRSFVLYVQAASDGNLRFARPVSNTIRKFSKNFVVVTTIYHAIYVIII